MEASRLGMRDRLDRVRCALVTAFPHLIGDLFPEFNIGPKKGGAVERVQTVEEIDAALASHDDIQYGDVSHEEAEDIMKLLGEDHVLHLKDFDFGGE